MKKNINKTIIILIISISLILVGILLFLNNDSNNKLDKENVSNNNSVEKSCKMVLETTDNSIINLVITYKIVDGIIISATNHMLIECKTDEYYNSLKDYEDYAKDKNFDDGSITVSFQEGDESNYKELKIKYNEYKLDLEKNNYICD